MNEQESKEIERILNPAHWLITDISNDVVLKKGGMVRVRSDPSNSEGNFAHYLDFEIINDPQNEEAISGKFIGWVEGTHLPSEFIGRIINFDKKYVWIYDLSINPTS